MKASKLLIYLFVSLTVLLFQSIAAATTPAVTVYLDPSVSNLCPTGREGLRFIIAYIIGDNPDHLDVSLRPGDSYGMPAATYTGFEIIDGSNCDKKHWTGGGTCDSSDLSIFFMDNSNNKVTVTAESSGGLSYRLNCSVSH